MLPDGGEMSLINDVLRNLEAKRPDELAGQNLQREIRSLPAAVRPRTGVRLLLAAGLAGALAVAVWLWPYGSAPEPAVAAPSLAVISQPVAESALAPVPLSPLPIVAPDFSPVVTAPSVPEATTAVDTARPSLSLASSLSEAPPPQAVPNVPAPAAAVPAVVPAAKIEMSPALATSRDRADAEWRRGEAALAGGRAEEGREALRAALRHDPGHQQVRQALLRNLLEARRLDEATKVLQEGLDLQPAQAGWAMSLARLQLEQGDVAAADNTLARSQSYAENNADYAGFQGHLKTRLGSHRQAAAHYQRAARLAPNDGRWWLGLGLALESDGRLPEGREALRRALASGNLPADLAAVAEQHLR